MELKQNLLEDYKKDKIIETNNETKKFLIERDNDIFKLYQQGKILQWYKVVSKIPKTIKTEVEWQGFFGQILCRVIISVLYWC